MRVLDWLFRTAMLALAGLVTLSILGAIDAASTRDGPGGFIAERFDAPAPDEAEPAEAADAAEPAAGADRGAGTAAGEAVAVRPREAEPRWLEAIAYALLAVAGLLAIALLLLGSAARDLRRIADALERGRDKGRAPHDFSQPS